MSKSEVDRSKNYRRIRRRDLLAGTAAGIAALGLGRLPGSVAHAIDYVEAPAKAVGISAYQDGGHVFVRWNNTIAIGYRANQSLKYPYFAPLMGPVTGLSLTTESSLPYPHHRGLWLGCEPLNEGDFWSDGSLQTGQIRSTDLRVESANDSVVVIHDACEWIRQQSSPLKDRRRFAFSVPSERIRLLDVEIDLTAREDLRIDHAKHSFFALRAAADISPIHGGTLMNSSGAVGAADTFGQPASWCGYFGQRDRSDVVEGIAILNHPDNFGGDCPWFTRNYGHLSPSPFNFLSTPWVLERGATLALRYCVVLHAGTPQQADLEGIYKQWVNGDGWFISMRKSSTGQFAGPISSALEKE
ncbi:MAG: PmoA family protein [Pirellulales bacterium]